MKKIALLCFAYLCLIVLTTCGNEGDTAEHHSNTEPEITIQPTPQPIQTPSPRPLPTPTPHSNTDDDALLQPHYTQITGRITAIHGLITDDGLIHEFVDWVHIYIEDESTAGRLTRLIATEYTLIPFGNLFVGETLTAFIHNSSAMLADQPPTFHATALAAGIPDGLGISMYYVLAPTQHRRIPLAGDILTANGRYYAINRYTEPNMFTWVRQNQHSMGFAIVYELPARDSTEPLVIVDGMTIHESLGFHIGDNALHVGFQLPVIRSLDDFTALDLPVFVYHELLDLHAPPILYHDGTTVMVPFRPLAESFGWWVDFAIGSDGIWIGPIGGGSGESAMMRPDSNVARGMGFFARFDATILMVEGMLYVPLLGFFAGAPPWPPSDAFIYNGKIHVVNRGWCLLLGQRFLWWLYDEPPERLITADVSALPIYVDGRRMSNVSAFLADDGYSIMLPIVSLAEALGIPVTPKPCGRAVLIEEDTFISGSVLVVNADVDVREYFPDAQGWHYMAKHFELVGGELYACFWHFFREVMNVGGFTSYTRIELFNTGARRF